jgi:hypothetical protein
MLRFTIRDVLWLTVVVALGLVLMAEYRSAAKWRTEAQQWRSRAESAASAVKGAERPNAWHESNVVVVEPAAPSGAPIQRVYKPAK